MSSAGYVEGGSIGVGLCAVALAIVKVCSDKGLFLRTPCGSEHDCIVDLNEGRPVNYPRSSAPKAQTMQRYEEEVKVPSQLDLV